MSHQLSSIHIVNYKSIKDCELTLTDYTPLVGYNNAGKSNIINAIIWLVQKSTLSQNDFHDTTKPIEITGRITGITTDLLNTLDPKHKTQIEKFIQDGVLTIKRIQETPVSKPILLIQKTNYSNEDERWSSNPAGIENAINGIFPEPIHIGAMENAEEDVSKSKAGSTIGKLLARIIEPIEKKYGDQIKQELAGLSNLLDAESNDRAEELVVLDKEMNEKIDAFFQGVNVKVHIPTPELKEVFSKGTLKVFEETRIGGKDVSTLGHGAQRSIQMALIQYLSEIQKNSENDLSRTLLLIDEPELYLHPQAIDIIRDALKSLSTKSYQVIFSTHSPMLISHKDMPNTILVRKSINDGTHRKNTLIEAVAKLIQDKPSQVNLLFSLSNSSRILFSETIILTEGKTEKRLLPIIFEAITSKSLGYQKLALIGQGGSGDTKNSMSILNAMGLPVKAIVDLDFAFKMAIPNKILNDNDEDYLRCKNIMAEIAPDKGIKLGDDGWPTKHGAINPENSFALLGNHPDAIKHIAAIHKKLCDKNIWIWQKGSIEHHLGIEEKNENAWASFAQSIIDNSPEKVIVDYQSVKDCIEWLIN